MTKKNNYFLRKNNRNSKIKRKIYRKSKKSIKSRLFKKFKGGDCSRKVLQVSHPLSQFINKRLGDKYIIIFSKDNCDRIDYDNIYVKAFFNKIIEMLNFSFEKEREYHISIGTYSPGHRHNLDTVKQNLHNPTFNTYCLLSDQLQPISYLYVEKNENDYDKVWTVCTDKEHREGGMASLLINFMLVNQMNDRRNKMMLEVYDDDKISRDENDVKQKLIMKLFGQKGFVHTPKEELEPHSQNNLLGKNDETKVMVFNPQEFIKNNPEEERNLNSNGRKSCGFSGRNSNNVRRVLTKKNYNHSENHLVGNNYNAEGNNNNSEGIESNNNNNAENYNNHNNIGTENNNNANNNNAEGADAVGTSTSNSTNTRNNYKKMMNNYSKGKTIKMGNGNLEMTITKM